METSGFDAGRSEAFGVRMLGLLNDSLTAMAVSVGHQTGLFDTMAGRAASSSGDIAAAAGLQERYVREWLAAMTVAGIVEHDADLNAFRLPDEHARFLTRAAGSDNLATFTQYVALIALAEPSVVACFRDGGGVPYSVYGRFQDVMAEDSAATFGGGTLVERVLPLVPGLVDRLTRGIDVVDVGCGQGVALRIMAAAYPRSRFLGLDFSPEGIAAAAVAAANEGLSNVRFETSDLAELNRPAAFDFVTAFDVVHDLARPEVVLRGIKSALRPDGVFLAVDIAASSRLVENLDHPLGPFLYAVSLFHCMTVSLAQGGPGLGAMWGEQRALDILRAAGFRAVDAKRLDGDIFHAYYVCRP